MQRYLESFLAGHLGQHRQMLFLSGPRQVGKTTIGRALVDTAPANRYLNWDDQADRALLLRGPTALADAMGLERLRSDVPLCVLDEVHKYADWRTLLKGFFDRHEEQVRVLVTGSAALDVFRRGGDSLMGRYFPLTLHPLSVAELAHGAPGEGLVRAPGKLPDDAWQALEAFGGFPEPFLTAERRFYNRWRGLRTAQLLKEDLRDLTRIQELGQVEHLALALAARVGQLTSHSSLAREVRVSVDTVRRWIGTLEALYWCFQVRPWHRNVSRALRKEPKYYLWDWSLVSDPGARAENIVASALLKAVHWWTETGEGDFDLRFIRDKEKREVDFVVVRDGTPWFLVEVKRSAGRGLSPHLAHFQAQTGAAHAFQVAFDADHVEADAFERTAPVEVPARTLLAQLV